MMINWQLVYLIGFVLTLVIVLGEVFLYSPKHTTDRLPAYLIGFIISFFVAVWPLFWILFSSILIVSFFQNYNLWKEIEKELDDNPILLATLQDEIRKSAEQYPDNDIVD